MASLTERFGSLFRLSGVGASDTGALGVEIGASSIKIVELGFDEDHVPVVRTYGELQLGPSAGRESGRVATLSSVRLAEALAAIVRDAKVTTKRAALAIPYKASFVVNVALPTQDPAQLAAMVPIEARKYVPLPMNEVTLDWFIIPDAAVAPAEKEAKEAKTTPHRAASREVRVLLAAIHNETFAEYQAVTAQAGLSAGMTEIEAFSVLRACLADGDTEVMIVDYGASAAKLHIVSGGVLREAHHTPSGGELLTTSLAEALSVDFAEAERLKRRLGIADGGDNPRVRQTLEPLVDRVLVAGKRVLDAYERDTGAKVRKIILTGGGALLPGLSERAGAMFGREVVQARPFDKVSYPTPLGATLVEVGPSFATALGVALRHLFEQA